MRWVWTSVGDGLEEPGGLLRSPGRDTKIVGNAHVADEDAPVEQRRPRGVRVGEPAEQHEVGVARHRVEARARAAPRRSGRAASLIASTVSSMRSACAERGERDRLGLGREVVRHPHQAQRVDERGVGGEVAEPATGERERLAHRAGHHEPRPRRRAGSARSACPAGRTRRTPRRRRPAPLAPRRAPPRRRRGRGRCRSGCSASRGRRRPGRCRRTCADGGCRVEVERSPAGHAAHPVDQVVPVVVVMIGCIEYAGVKPSAVRPGPPKAWSRCSSTSFDPLPAHTCSAVTPCRCATGRPRAPRAAR